MRTVLTDAGYPTAKIAYQQALDGSEFLEIKVGASGVASEGALEAVKHYPANIVIFKMRAWARKLEVS